jgi:hypothetical protein
MLSRDDVRVDPLSELGGATRRRVQAVLREYGTIAGADRSTARLRAMTGDALDLTRNGHRVALLDWLREWGCRHLRVADSSLSSRALAEWWTRWEASLPEPGRPLVDLSRRQQVTAAEAFGELAAAPAAVRSSLAHRVSVSFGQTAAAKALFAIRPLAFPPWDEPIRTALRLRGSAGYRSYLEQVARALIELSARLGIEVEALPSALGRPASSPPKLVDEYLWMRVSRNRG